jgi:hypothetical protein
MSAPTAAFEVIAESGLLALVESGVESDERSSTSASFRLAAMRLSRAFLAGASSFANASGRDRVFRIEAPGLNCGPFRGRRRE